MLDLEDELMDWYSGKLDNVYQDEASGLIYTMRQWIKIQKVKGVKYNNIRCSEICSELDALTRMASLEIVRY